MEESYKFGAFFSSYLNESDFYAKPSVLLLGQYSTGELHSDFAIVIHAYGRKYEVCAHPCHVPLKHTW